MADEFPPDWAIERALSLGFTGTRLEDVKRHWPGHTAHIAFARYIAEHEDPPVDPLVEQAQELADELTINLSAMPWVERVLMAALRRGMELAHAQEMERGE